MNFKESQPEYITNGPVAVPEVPYQGAAMEPVVLGRSAVFAAAERPADETHSPAANGEGSAEVIESAGIIPGEGGGIKPPTEPPVTAEGSAEGDDAARYRRMFLEAELAAFGASAALLTANTYLEPTPAERQVATDTLQAAIAKAVVDHADIAEQYTVYTDEEAQGTRIDLRYMANGIQSDVRVEGESVYIKNSIVYAPEQEATSIPPHSIPPADMISYHITDGRVNRHSHQPDGPSRDAIGENEAMMLSVLLEQAKPPVYTLDEVADMTPVNEVGFVAAMEDVPFLDLEDAYDREHVAELAQNAQIFSDASKAYIEQAGKTFAEGMMHEELRHTEAGGTVTIRLRQEAGLPAPDLEITERRTANPHEIYTAATLSTVDTNQPMTYRRTLTVTGTPVPNLYTSEDMALVRGFLTETVVNPANVWADPTESEGTPIRQQEFLLDREDLRVLRRYLLQGQQE